MPSSPIWSNSDCGKALSSSRDAKPRGDPGHAHEGLFALKSALLFKRARSRDYFDLMWFRKHAGKTLEDLIAAALLEDDSPEVPAVVEHKLLGLIPVDPDDEGLDPVEPSLGIPDVYRFLWRREVATARALLAKR